MSFGIATFYVSFSIGSFNSSAYRSFHSVFPPRLLVGCIFLVVLSFIPLVVLVVIPDVYLKTCLVLLPVLAISGVGLLDIARIETTPANLLQRLCSVRKAKQYLRSLAPLVEEKVKETNALNLTKAEDRPTHEFGWHLFVPLQQADLLQDLASLGLLAIRLDDHYVFNGVMRRGLEILNLTKTIQLNEKSQNTYLVRKELFERTEDVLKRIVTTLQSKKAAASLMRVAIDVFAEEAVAKTKKREQTQDIVFSILHLMSSLGKSCYTIGSKSDIRIPLIVSRQLVQKGVDDPLLIENEKNKHSTKGLEFQHALPQLSDVIKEIGSFAVKNNDSNLLYRCFNAFSWLGCAAIKSENFLVTTACLRGLSQLGRLARAKNLECFWDKCAVKPEDHAAEHIEWISTWTARMLEDKRNRWVELIEVAYSRLYGKKTSISIESREEQPFIQRNISDEHYTESYYLQAGSRNVDYSDFTFLKDLELRGKMEGGYFQGPIIPLNPVKIK